MPYNRTTRVKRGSTGHIITVTFYNEAGALHDLTGHTVVIEVTAEGDATNLLAGTNMTVSNQTTNTGEATYVMTSADALIAAGNYEWEARATHTASGRVYIAPNSDGTDFGIFKMIESKIAA